MEPPDGPFYKTLAPKSSTDGISASSARLLSYYTTWTQETIHCLQLYLPRFAFCVIMRAIELKLANVFQDLLTID